MTPKEKYLQFIQSVKPQVSFEDDNKPKAPDYLSQDCWAALPGRHGAHFLSPDETASEEPKDYDVFYIHPTGYFQPHWNAPLDIGFFSVLQCLCSLLQASNLLFFF
jgi:hypothetical protein